MTADNLRAAQEAYTDKLFALLPQQPCRILDIGGGAGETARKLLALGHQVDIVVPSPDLAARCRANAPAARVHDCRFEDFTGTGPFDICLFSESFQYIPLDKSLSRCLELLAPGGAIVLADCFRSPTYNPIDGGAVVGGGHAIGAFRDTLSQLPLTVAFEEDITLHTAPSVEIEQGLFNAFGYALDRIDRELREKRPRLRWALVRAIRLVLDTRKRRRLSQRLNEQSRNRTVFAENNIYLMMKLLPNE